ncbi:MAG: hypothetical protein VW642_13185 [Halieaceae bacterium]|jgi:hypothetical protein
MNIHLLFRRERIADLVSVLTPDDTVILMEEALADHFCTTISQLRCNAKVLSDNATPSERTLDTVDWVTLMQAHRHCISWD